MSAPASQPITLLLERVNAGEHSAETELFTAVYEELRQMARTRAKTQDPGSLLQATALVNEAYLKLSSGRSTWDCRAHFFGAAGRAMRNIVADDIRRRSTAKHGNGLDRVDLDTHIEGPYAENPGRVLEVDEALKRLEQEQPRAARIVELRYFVGLTDEETAEALDISVRTVYREWSYAKAWLHRDLQDNQES